jgi:hypothetical protein
MKQGLVQLFVVLTLTLIACKRGPEGPAGPQGPAGPDYVAPYQQGYIRGTIIAQDTFNNRASGKATTMFIIAKARVMSIPAVVP